MKLLNNFFKLRKLRLYKSAKSLPPFFFITTAERSEHLEGKFINYEKELALKLIDFCNNNKVTHFIDIGAAYSYFSILLKKKFNYISLKCYDPSFIRSFIGRLNLFLNGTKGNYSNKFVGAKDDQKSISLKTIIESLPDNSYPLIKCDIEGNEYDLLINSLDELINKDFCLFLEFHERIMREELYLEPNIIKELLVKLHFNVIELNHRTHIKEIKNNINYELIITPPNSKIDLSFFH